MKSIKNKLFFSYLLILFIALSVLSFLTVSVFKENQERKSLENLETNTKKVIENIKKSKNQNFDTFDKNIDLKSTILLIFENNSLVFTNTSAYKTQRIFYELEEEDDYEADEDEILSKISQERVVELYEEYQDLTHIEIDNYILTMSLISKNDKEYLVFLALNSNNIEESFEDFFTLLIVLNIILYLVLGFFAYFLISKTLFPLKLILEELKVLQKKADLTLRLKLHGGKDEFDDLSSSFNVLLENIQHSVENIKQFTADASHELKTPLTIIQGEIDLAKKEDISKEELEKTLQIIDKEQKNLQDIIENFLLLAKLDKEVFHNKKAFLDKVVFDVIEQNLSHLEKKNLELKLDIEENLEIQFDEKYLFIVLSNLLSNAIKYTQSGYIRLLAKKMNNEIVFMIEDSGQGIKKEDINKIFERFFRVEKVRTSSMNGLGLGLSIVKKICDRFNYAITVKSIENKGSTFMLKKK
ncbi:MAG: hypothetical protein COA66_05210 [Arcobacter sp.]|nr:MAG: hypothetical protein COA66_05210 [Arcobacter sp.]